MGYSGLRKFKLKGESLEDVTHEFPIGKDHADYLFLIHIVVETVGSYSKQKNSLTQGHY